MNSSSNETTRGLLLLTGSDVGRAIFALAIGVVAMVGNLFLLVLVVKYKTLRNNDCIYQIACLAFCDCLAGAGCLVYGVGSVYLRTMVVDHYPSRFECMIFGVVGIFGVQAGQLATLAIAADRFTALADPVKYMTVNHTNSAVIWATFIFIYSTLAVGAMFLGIDLWSPPETTCNAGGSVSIAWATYWSSFSLVNGALITGLYVAGYATLVSKYGSGGGNDAQTKNAISKQKAVSNSITIIMLVYAACWLAPNVGLFLAGVLNDQGLYGFLTPIAAVGSGVNSSVNVFIYGLKHQQIKQHMLMFVRRKTVPSTAGRTMSVVPVTSVLG